jgi:hypothetical protein
MATSILEQYRISDLLEWYEKKQLIPNPEFQRRSVWSTDAKVYLIDTILRSLPMPKIYLRTKVDLHSRKSYREIVDGQQRLRAIIDFSLDRFSLTKRAKELQGLKYSTLGEELQESFLTYAIAVDQLINASDSDVLEIFARLNSYTVSLNAPELRHASYDTEFKWSVHEAASRWNILWERFHVVGTKQRLRMADDSLMAEFFGVVLQGITDGGQPKIKSLYERFKVSFPDQLRVEGDVDQVLGFITGNFGDVLDDATVANAPHFLMLFAAVAHALVGIPEGEMIGQMPRRGNAALTDLAVVSQNLATINTILESDEPDGAMKDFWKASSSSTQRIASRKIRFPVYYRALLPTPL